jgi:hypothetical protein
MLKFNVFMQVHATTQENRIMKNTFVERYVTFLVVQWESTIKSITMEHHEDLKLFSAS